MFLNEFKTVSGDVAIKCGKPMRFGLQGYLVKNRVKEELVYLNEQGKSVLPPYERFDNQDMIEKEKQIEAAYANA